MSRPRKEPPAPSSIVPSLVRYARARGLDVEILAVRFGLPAGVEQEDEVVAGTGDPHEIFDWIARACGEPDVALRLGAAFPMRRYGFAELTARASDTLGRALGVLARYAPLLHVDFEAALEVDGAGAPARWVARTPRRPRGAGRYLNEFVLAHTMAQARALDAGLVASRAWFANARPRDVEPLHAAFGTRDLTFGGPDSGLAFDAAVLDRALPGADDRMRATMEPLAEAALRARSAAAAPPSLAARVSARLVASLPEGADVAVVAAALHMSPRTLQRRLEEEGTAFTEVLDRARLELARTALQDRSASLTAIAFRLGFADLATFSRAFKRWTGQPPGQWRGGQRG
ncbi:MAG TPA: helix-turn-helix domain-containing protein [Polyangiaceae bacterium]|jgi:AraC-like DNA-binding protein|nr:helix-turn-helix domain-containing protein [Polyangiaceae bacterium]